MPAILAIAYHSFVGSSAPVSSAFSSIGWAATAALLLALPLAGLISGLITAGLVVLTWKFSPKRNQATT